MGEDEGEEEHGEVIGGAGEGSHDTFVRLHHLALDAR